MSSTGFVKAFKNCSEKEKVSVPKPYASCIINLTVLSDHVFICGAVYVLTELTRV